MPDAAMSSAGNESLREQMLNEAAANAENATTTVEEGQTQEVTLSEDATVEDIRAAVGEAAEGLTDEEVQEEWEKVKAEQAGYKLDFPLYNAEGVKVDSLEGVTLEDFLSGKYQIGYQAMDKEQRKAFKDLIRLASNGHYNEHKYTTAVSERDRIHRDYGALKSEHEAWAADRQVWDRVLMAAAAGNVEPLQKLIDNFTKGLTEAPATPGPDVQSQQWEADGRRFVEETVTPWAYKLAQEHGADPNEVKRYALDLMMREGEFITKEKVDFIMQREVPEALALAKGNKPATDPQVAELIKQVQELKAAAANAKVDRLKTRKAPPAGAGATRGSGDTVPVFEKAEDYKEWLRQR